MRNPCTDKDQKGQSLVQVIVGIAVTLIVIGAIALLVFQLKKGETKAVAQNSVLDYHEAAVNALRNIRAVQNLVDSSPNLVDCLKGTYGLSFDCQKFQASQVLEASSAGSSMFRFKDKAAASLSASGANTGNFSQIYNLLSVRVNAKGEPCSNQPQKCYFEVQSTVQADRCDKPSRCQALRFVVKTRRLPNTATDPVVGEFKDKTTELSYPGIVLTGDAQLDFNKDGCQIALGQNLPTNTYVTGLNYDLRKSNCEGPLADKSAEPFTGCANLEPMQSYYQPGKKLCPQLVNANCTEGIQKIGAFEAQEICTPIPKN